MKRYILACTLAIACLLAANGQRMTPSVTVYNEFQPATVYLANGRTMKLPLANIFLKNSSLLYKSGTDTKEANMNNVLRVDFGDRTYIKLDSVLGCLVDTVGHDCALYRVERIDFVAYKQMVINNTEFTSIDFGDLIGYTTSERVNAEDLHFPVFASYYIRWHDHIVPAHERNLKKVLDKERKRRMEGVMAERKFKWTDEEALISLLKAIQ